MSDQQLDSGDEQMGISPRQNKKVLQDIITNLFTAIRNFWVKLMILFSTYFTGLSIQSFIKIIYKILNMDEDVIQNLPNEVYSQKKLEKIIDRLLELGYDEFLSDKSRITPIMYTVKCCHEELTESLLDHLKDVNVDNNIFNKPVKIETYVGDSLFDETYANSKFIKMVNAHDPNGKTALNYAVDNECFDIAYMLLLHGADISFLDTESQKELLLNSAEKVLEVHYKKQHNLTPVVGLLIINIPEALKGYGICECCKLLRRFLWHGHSKVVAYLINSVQDKDEKKLLLNEIFDSDSIKLCDYDYLQMTKYLFQQGVENELDSSFPARTLLYFTASKGYLETFKYFVKKFDDNDKSCFYSCLMKIAISECHFNIIEYIWNNYREHTFVSENTPLHYAASDGHLEIVKYFCENGADINKVNDFGYTPLDEAIIFYHPKTIKYLISECNAHTHNGTFWDSRSVKATYDDRILQKILHLKPKNLDDIDNYYVSTDLLLGAVLADDLQLMENLVIQGVNINHIDDDLGITPLHLAVQNTNSNATKFLLQHGAVYDIKFTWMTIFDLSIYHNRLILKIVDQLFKTSSLVQELKTAIDMLVSYHDAYDQNNPMVFLMNVKNQREQTLLHKAVVLNDKDAIELLLKYNKSYIGIKRLGLLPHVKYYVPINTVLQDFEGNTPLHLAAQNGNIEIASLLINENPNSINIKNKIGYMPIDVAKQYEQQNFVEFLLEKTSKPKKGIKYNRIPRIELLI